MFAGAERLRALLEAEPGTYVLTDYLATSFHRSVVVELGLDRYPGAARRLLRPLPPRRLARPAPDRPRSARRRSGRPGVIGLPLEEVVVGDQLLELALAELLTDSTDSSD